MRFVPCATAATAAGTVGDANCDGTVNAVDALFLLQFVADFLDALPCPGAADADENGQLSAIDSALILQFVAGLLPTLPP